MDEEFDTSVDTSFDDTTLDAPDSGGSFEGGDVDNFMSDTVDADDYADDFYETSSDIGASMDDSADVSGIMDSSAEIGAIDDQTLDVGGLDESSSDIGSLMDDVSDVDSTMDGGSDADLYQATPISDMQIVQEDGSVDILENIMAANADTDADVQTDASQPLEDQFADGSDAALVGANDMGGETVVDHSDVQETAYDQLKAYMFDHNYGKQHEVEYSQDPEWQELNNAFRVEQGLEPINYGTEDWTDTHVDDVRAELVAMGIPEDSPELEAILQNEQQGIDAIRSGDASSDVDGLMDDTDDVSGADVQAAGGGEFTEASEDITALMDDVDASGETGDVATDTGSETGDVASPMDAPIHMTQSDVDWYIENANDPESLRQMQAGIASRRIVVDADTEIPTDAAIENVPDGETETDCDLGASDTDWERTSLTKEQEAQLEEMAEKGEIDIIEVEPNLPDPEHADLHLPTKKTGEFFGEVGNSAFVPKDIQALQKMVEYGQSSVEYVDGYPEFAPFTSHESAWGTIHGQVEIPHMTDQRKNPTWEYGRRPGGASHDPNYDLGNFAQADNALLEQLKGSNPDLTADDIQAYREAKRLVWHECADGKTMQLVPIEIHNACRHSGGVSDMKYRMAWGDIRLDYD